MKREAAEFLEAMYEKAYSKVINHNRPPDPWNHFDEEYLIKRMREELVELEEALEEGDVTGVMDELTDVANFCMFLWIKKRQEQPVIERDL